MKLILVAKLALDMSMLPSNWYHEGTSPTNKRGGKGYLEGMLFALALSSSNCFGDEWAGGLSSTSTEHALHLVSDVGPEHINLFRSAAAAE